MKMYVLVRRDLNETYRNVQGTHAVAKYSLHGDPSLYRAWGNSTLVHLGVRDEHALRRWSDRLSRKGKKFKDFREPDLGGQLTALACVDDGHVFRKLDLA